MARETIYDIKQIAEALGVSERAVRNRANKGRKKNKNHPAESPWTVHSTEKRNGRDTRLFSFAELPKYVKEALDIWVDCKALKRETDRINAEYKQLEAEALEKSLEATFVKKVKADADEKFKHKQENTAKFNRLAKDEPKRQRAEAKKFLLFGCFELRRQQQVKKTKSWYVYAEKINSGEITLPAWIVEYIPQREGVRTLFGGTMKRWEYDYASHGIWGLTDDYGKRKGQTKIATNPKLLQVVLGAMIKFPQVTGLAIKQYLGAEHPELNIVSERRIGQFLTNWKKDNAQLWTMISNPDKWKNVFMSAAGSHHDHIERLNQLWELDSTPGDWLLTDGRHSVVGVIDMFSRRLKFYVSKTSSAMAVCQVFRRALIDWGVPEMVRTDNGKDYVSKQFCLALNELEIKQEVCIPFASEQKGTIERHMRTMTHGILNLLPGFIGHNVGERKVIEARKSFADRIMKKGEVVEVSMTSEELQEILDKWTEHYYEHSVHGGLNGMSPFEKAQSYTGVTNVIHHLGALDMLLAENTKRQPIITKKGIRFNRHYYFNDDLFRYVGKQVSLKYDEQDIGRLYAYVEGKFVGVVVCHQLLGISRKEAATVAKIEQKKYFSKLSKELKLNKKYVADNIAEKVLNHRIEQSENVTAFPAKTQPYTTPALDQAKKAAENNPDVIQGDFPLQRQADEVDELLNKPLYKIVGGNDMAGDTNPEDDEQMNINQAAGIAILRKQRDDEI